MTNFEWIEFIEYLTKKGKKVNLKKECEQKNVGLNTLYRKVIEIKDEHEDIYSQFMTLHPYKPRDIEGIDFEQLMRESIIDGASQKDLENKYYISKRTIQRKFAKIEEDNEDLYNLYKQYTNAILSGKPVHYSIIEKATIGYVPQTVVTEEKGLKIRRKEFLNRIQNLEDNDKKNASLINFYKDQITRVDQEIKQKELEEEK